MFIFHQGSAEKWCYLQTTSVLNIVWLIILPDDGPFLPKHVGVTILLLYFIKQCIFWWIHIHYQRNALYGLLQNHFRIFSSFCRSTGSLVQAYPHHRPPVGWLSCCTSFSANNCSSCNFISSKMSFGRGSSKHLPPSCLPSATDLVSHLVLQDFKMAFQ